MTLAKFHKSNLLNLIKYSNFTFQITKAIQKTSGEFTFLEDVLLSDPKKPKMVVKSNSDQAAGTSSYIWYVLAWSCQIDCFGLE